MSTETSIHRKTQHILPTAANLLGTCFMVLSFSKIQGFSKSSYLDEAMAIPMVFFFFSCIFSYFSIRREENSDTARLEKYADQFFMIALFVMLGIFVVFLVELN